MKYRRIFQMILVCITGILLSGCRGQIEEQKKKKQDTHQDSTIQIYKTVGNVSQGIESWWFKRNEEHQQPEVSQKIDLSKYDAYYVDPKCTEKKIYLTFDCGYENGFTPKILDVLKRQKVVAAFFVTKPFIREEAKLVKLADKICNLRDILASPPADWSPERKQGYFDWAAKVVAGVRGVHPELEAVFDGLLARHAELR